MYAEVAVEQNEVERRSQQLLDSLIIAGYPLAVVETDPVTPSDTFLLSYTPGPYIQAPRFVVEPSENLPPWLYEYWLRPYENRAFLRDDFRQLDQTAASIPYIEEVYRGLPYREDSLLLFPTSITSTSSFMVQGGVAYSNQTSEGLHGDLSLSLLHLLGFGEEFFLEYVGSDEVRELSTRLRVPHLFQGPFHLRSSFSLELRGDSYSFFQYSLGGVYPVYTDGVEISLAVSAYEVQDDTVRRTFRGVDFGASSVQRLFRAEERGLFWYIQSETGQVRSEGAGQLMSRFTSGGGGQHPLGRFALYSEIHPWYLYVGSYDDLTLSEVFRLGGEQTIRGYARKSIPQTAHLLTRSELRYFPDATTMVYLLFDTSHGTFGHVTREGWRSRFSYGTGLSLRTRAVQMYLEWANHQNNPLSQSFIHFRIAR